MATEYQTKENNLSHSYIKSGKQSQIVVNKAHFPLGTLETTNENATLKPIHLSKIPRIDIKPILIANAAKVSAATQIIPIPDIDAEDHDNCLHCSEYAKDIYSYLYSLEKRHLPDPDYITKHQTDISLKMRTILIDWLIQVHLRFKLIQETLYLTISILDRFLALTPVKRNKLQLVGVSSMLLASKFEEIYTPEIRDFVYITDNAYTAIEIREMEREIFQSLTFFIGPPLCLHFLRRYSKAGEATQDMHMMSKFLMELCLPDAISINTPPSVIAAAALCVSSNILHIDDLTEPGGWNITLEHYSGYKEKELLLTMKRMSRLLQTMDTSKQRAIYLKYSSVKFLEIAQNKALIESAYIKELLS